MKRIPSFQAATGVYKEAIRPYLSWHERSEMSPLIEFEGKDYRYLMSLLYWRRVGGRKFVVSDDQGNVMSSESITRHCKRIITYLSMFLQAESSEDFYLEGGEAKRHEPTIRAMSQIRAYISDNVTDAERKGLEKHQTYLEQHYHISQQMMRVTERQMTCRRKVENLQGDKLTQALVEEMVETLNELTRWELAFRANLVSNREGRRVTWTVLTDKERMKHYPDKEDIQHVIREVHGSSRAVKMNIETDEEYKKFPTEEEYLHFLRYEADEEGYIQGFVEEGMIYSWALSPKCKWLK